jgi:hypothetical protein
MTLTAESPDSTLQDSFWADSNLPDAQVEDIPPDDTHLINPPERVCPGCGEEVVRVPGTKGRLPKYHPECKPAKGSVSSGPRTVRVSAKDRLIAEEIEAALEQVRVKLAKAVMLLSLADPYDAFVIHVNTPEILENLRPVLYRYAWMREAATNTSAGLSLLGLVVTLLTTALPIAAHHNLIPSKKVAQLMMAIPMIMKRMQENVGDNGEDMGAVLMTRMREQLNKQNEARMRAQAQEENIDASHSR